MTRYLILIYGNESRWESMTASELEQIDSGHRAFRARTGQAVLTSGQLEPSSTVTTLRGVENGVPVITDGPYAETKEVLGGFYLVSAADLDEAISYAGGLAEVRHDHSWVEIWPLVDHGEGQ